MTMAIKPIPFSTPMVQAIMAGRKTMTRRISEPQTYFYPLPDSYAKYHTGDILWVRETWAKHGDADFSLDGIDETNNINPQYDDGGVMGTGVYIFKADGVRTYEGCMHKEIKWRPSIFMPKEACRLFLRVTDVHIERLQEITPRDAWEEGCRIGTSFPFEEHIADLQQMGIDILFRPLWDSLYAKRGYGWDVNPWVWVYTFERCEKPEGWCK